MPDERETIDLSERRVDAALSELPLNVHNLGMAAWLLLTAMEDALRLPLIVHHHTFDPVQYISSADALKYGLKHALSNVSARPFAMQFQKIPKAINTAHYAEAGQLLFRGTEYQAAVIAFSSYRAGVTECNIVGNELTFRPTASRDIRLKARDMLEAMAGSGRTGGTSPLMTMANWLRDGGPPPLVDHIKKTASISGDRVMYKDTPEGDLLIYDVLGTGSALIPNDWSTQYGSKSTIEALLRAVLALHALHCLTVNTIARKRRGACIPSIVLAITREDLIRRMHRLTGIDPSLIAEFVQLLEYASGRVQSPDPALQPFFPADENLLLSAPMSVCCSDLERNFLTLLARMAPKEFDRASHAFERQMVSRFKDSFSKPEWQSVYNRTIAAIRHAGEIDCLLLDATGRTILVLELWWQIPPAETREVALREEQALQKAKQANSKQAAVQANLPAVLNSVGLPMEDGWTAHALLVSESFLPTRKNTEDVPVISRRAIQGLLNGPHMRLADVWRAIQMEVWLPREGDHFTTEIAHYTLNGIRFSNLRVSPTLGGVLFAYITMDKNPPLHIQVQESEE